MTDRVLIKGGIVLTQDPALGEMAGADVLVEDDKIAAVGRNLSADGARTIDASRRHRDPGLHRHPPAHLGDVDPDLRARLRADHVLRLHPRQVRAALPARRRVRRQPVGLARVHQRGHHDARRLVAHHEHARPRGRSHPRPPGLEHPLRLRLRVRQHVARRLVVRAGLHRQRPDLGRAGCATDPEAVLQLRRRPDHDGARDPWSELLQARGRPPRLGAGQGARASTSPSTSRWTGSATRRCRSRPSGTWICSTRTRPTSTPRTSPRRSGRSPATRAGTSRSPRRSRSRWATAGRRR